MIRGGLSKESQRRSVPTTSYCKELHLPPVWGVSKVQHPSSIQKRRQLCQLLPLYLIPPYTSLYLLIPAYIPHPLLLPVVTGLPTTCSASEEPCSLPKAWSCWTGAPVVVKGKAQRHRQRAVVCIDQGCTWDLCSGIELILILASHAHQRVF